MANTKRTISEIRSSSELTPYEVFRLLQDAVSKIDSNRASALKPQMMYNYDRNGLIVKGRKASETKVAGRYTVQEADAFIQKWTSKNLKVQAVTQTPQDLINQYRVQINR